MERKRLSSEVAMKSAENIVEVFNMLLNLNQDLAKLKKKTAKIHIDLAIILKMNNEIATLSKEVSMIQRDLFSVLSKWENSIEKSSKRSKVGNDTTSKSSSSDSVRSHSEESK